MESVSGTKAHPRLPAGGLAQRHRSLVWEGKRSAFLTEIVEREVRKQKLLRALDEAAGCWKAEDHPELEKAPLRL